LIATEVTRVPHCIIHMKDAIKISFSDVVIIKKEGVTLQNSYCAVTV